MKMKYANVCVAVLLAILALSACSEADDQVPDGMARVEVRLSAPYQRATRATGDWLDPISSKEKIHDYWVVFVKSGVVEELVAGSCGSDGKEEDSFQFFLPPGTYTVYAFANLDFSALNIRKGAALPTNLTTKKLATTNGWTNDIPMSNNVQGQRVTVAEVENQSFEVELVRVMAKIQLDFENFSNQQIDILGYEIYPLTKTNVSLFEPAQPADIVTAATNSEAYTVDLSEAPITLTPINSSGHGGTGSAWCYVNETNATATATHNQYSIRLKVLRNTTVEEFRYGFTVNSASSGFDYIRRNDWIKLPIVVRDWRFRVEALPFPPIAGFQSRVVSADALSITFNTGGYIFLRPMFRKNSDPEGVWRNFDDSDVVFKLADNYTTNATTGAAECIDSESGTGLIMTGDLRIFEAGQYFTQLPSGDIVGKLDNAEGKTGLVTVTIKVKLEGLEYEFNYNIFKVN